ncbi:uncharacterized protein [Coffea arabica]|uniref:Chromo domain-containing protein n=1 Tax=Coffea arabica TaxID=13443 RepID=A0ABM4URA8_COFAR
MAEFAYNSSVNRLTGYSPFEAVTGNNPRKPIDLLPLPVSARPSAEAEAFPKHILDIHDEVRRRIATSNERYKAHTDLKKIFAEFEEGDYGPFKVLKKISSNAYVLELSDDMGISNVFNIEDLTAYDGHLDDSAGGTSKVALPPPTRLHEAIEDVLDHQIVSTRGGGYQKFLVHWRGQPRTDCTWITESEFQKLNPDFYERYQAINSPGSSLLKPRRDDRDRWQKSTKVYRRHGKDVSNAQALIWHAFDDKERTWELV